ncbi:MAG: hypothetical protein ABI797_00285 [Chloroflexota bacterium]
MLHIVWRGFLAFVCSFVLVLSLPVHAAYAAQDITCLNYETVSWRGVYNVGAQAGKRRGASGDASSLTFKLCNQPPTTYSASFYFSNVVPANGTELDIVQMGMGKCQANFYANCVSGQRYWSAWGRDNATPGCAGTLDHPPAIIDEGAYVAGHHVFMVWQDPSTNWSFYVDGVGVGAAWSSDICWSPDAAVWFT